MATSSSAPSLGTTSLHTAWLFQAIAAFPIALDLGAYVFWSLYDFYGARVYRFITYTFNAIFASAIVFLVIVQWSMSKRGASNSQMTFVMESTKALTATVMWLWLLLDSIFYDPQYRRDNRGKRITAAAVSVILVMVLFYPTAVYAAYARKQGLPESQERAGQAHESVPSGSERTPLLGSQGRSSEDRPV